MCAWLALVVACLKAEFPDFELLHAFSAFDVEGPADQLSTTDRDVHLKRLAKAFKVDPNALHQQFLDVLPDARQAPATDGALGQTAFQRWRHALDAIGLPHDELRAVLCRYGTCIGCTTSGVEQIAHSTQDLILTKRRGCLHNDKEANEMKIVTDFNAGEAGDVQKLARKIWKLQYGAPRVHRSVRRDKGRKLTSSRANERKTLKAFARDRRAEIDEVPNVVERSLNQVQRRAAKRGVEDWGAGMTEELEKHKCKRRRAKLRSLREGTLLPSEFDANDEADAAIMAEHEGVLRAGRIRVAGARTATLSSSRVDPSTLSGKTVFVEDGASDGSLVSPLGQCFRRLHLTMRGERVEAELFVARRPGQPSNCTKAALLMQGGWVCDHQYLAGNGAGGSLVKFNRMSSAQPRLIWVSMQFKSKHADIWNVMSATLPSNTSLAEIGRATFVDKTMLNAGRVARQQRNLQTIGLVTEAQKASDALSGLKYIFTFESLWARFCDVDQSARAIGACGL